MTDFPTHAQFAAHVKSEFTIHREDEKLPATLDRVSDIETSGPSESFSIFLEAPGECGLEQGSYKLEHPELGEMEIFLVPVAWDERGLRLQAVFNRLSV